MSRERPCPARAVPPGDGRAPARAPSGARRHRERAPRPPDPRPHERLPTASRRRSFSPAEARSAPGTRRSSTSQPAWSTTRPTAASMAFLRSKLDRRARRRKSQNVPPLRGISPRGVVAVTIAGTLLALARPRAHGTTQVRTVAVPAGMTSHGPAEAGSNKRLAERQPRPLPQVANPRLAFEAHHDREPVRRSERGRAARAATARVRNTGTATASRDSPRRSAPGPGTRGSTGPRVKSIDSRAWCTCSSRGRPSAPTRPQS